MMGQILVVYGSLVLAVCYMFRKYCQDPDLEKEEAEKALKKIEEKEAAAKAKLAGIDPVKLLDMPPPTKQV